jgi:hypothetical protein
MSKYCTTYAQLCQAQGYTVTKSKYLFPRPMEAILPGPRPLDSASVKQHNHNVAMKPTAKGSYIKVDPVR